MATRQKKTGFNVAELSWFSRKIFPSKYDWKQCFELFPNYLILNGLDFKEEVFGKKRKRFVDSFLLVPVAVIK